MVDAPGRPECRTCWQRLGGENAMDNWITKKAPAWLSEVFGVKCKQWPFHGFFLGWLEMIREERPEGR